MVERFYPDVFFNSFEEVTPEFLNEKGISAILLDIDNTLVPYAIRVPDEKVIRWLGMMKEKGIKVCVFSNAKEERVEKFTGKLKDLDIHVVAHARKPLKSGFKEALEKFELEPEQVAMIGDQIFTDIWGGNRSGLYTILIKPIDEDENRFIRFKRVLEKPVLHRYKKTL